MSVRDYLPPLVKQIVGLFHGSRHVEIVTNAMKYAFVGRERGTITVSAARTDNRAIIGIGDDGVGIPESVGIGSSAGLGFTLVAMIADQLDGTITLERSPGTRFVLEFPLSASNPGTMIRYGTGTEGRDDDQS